MGTLSKNINFVWYGDNCESCSDFSFYSGTDINSSFRGVLKVTDIKQGGYVYSAWSSEVHAENLKEFEKLPDIVKNTLGADYLKNGQGFDKFECGHAYIVEVTQGITIDIPNLFEVNLTDSQPRRLVDPCPTCPDEGDCDCSKKKFTFKKFDLDEEEFDGWEDPKDACFDNESGVIHEMVLSTEDVVVGTKLYLAERIATQNFMGMEYIDDKFSISSRYIYADNKAYKIVNRSIEEIIDCDDIKPTPTPTLVLDPPINEFCIVNSSVERNNGEYVLQQNEYNGRPVWSSSNNMFSYYGTPAGVSTHRWMISDSLGSNYGQFADDTGGSGPYDVTWNDNKKYYHTIVRGQCGSGNLYWTDYGDCVDGEQPLTRSGDSISLNKDATILAIGCTANSDAGQLAGHVRVFRLSNNKWEQMGQDIDGHNLGDFTGSSVSLNDSGNILAVGSYLAERIGSSDSPINETSDIGDVRLYKWNVSNNTWNPHGSPLFGDVTDDNFGISCQLNGSGDIVVVGASGFDGDATNSGLARVYSFEDSDWVQLGQDLYGEQSSGYGTNVTITKNSNLDKTIIGVVADGICEVWVSNDKENFQRRGQQMQIPSETDAGNIATNAPSSVSINESGDRIAVSVSNVLFNQYLESEETTFGITQVYQYNGVNDWIQLGSNLPGQSESVQLSATGSTLTISDVSDTNDPDGFFGGELVPGSISAYAWDESSWNLLGEKLYGKTHLDSFGFSTSLVMSDLGEIIIAVASPGHTQFIENAPEQLGQVCVYKSPQIDETLPTPVDCEYTQTPWGPCSQQCDPDGSGPGIQTRTTTVISEPLFGGAECPGTTVIQTCGEERCPIDCVVSDWTWNGDCSASCGGGVETAYRTILQASQFGGSPCPSTLTTTRPCNTQPCPENCEGVWDIVSPCDSDCGGGEQLLRFRVTKPAVGGGSCVNEGAGRVEPCNTQPCPVDCVGSWSDWGTCSSSCGGGKQTRTFVVSSSEQYGGTCVDRNKIETQDCNTQPCPTNCEGYWSTWSSCSETCGGGQQSRNFIVSKDEANGGTCTSRGQTETKPCNTQPCPTNCEGYWTDFGPCSKNCGTGTQTRSFVVTRPEENGGICPNKNGVESRNCNTQPCPTNCEGSWSNWSACTTSCGGGTQTRYYIVSRNEANGGSCPNRNKTESQSCNTQPCPTNCEGYWSSWGSCSKSCGGGTQIRSWVVTKNEANGGTCANRNQTQTQACNTQCCRQDCVGYWTDWGWNGVAGACSSSCGSGTQIRKWVVTTPNSCGGTCPYYNGYEESRTNNDCGCCPTNCVTGWQDGPCTPEGNMTSKDNIQYIKSTYEIITPASCGGTCSQNALNYVGNTKYEIGDDCQGQPLATYKITGFGGTEGDLLSQQIFYPVLWVGNGSGSNVPDLNPKYDGNSIVKGPTQGWYAYSCQSHADKGSGRTPCNGNRKYGFRTPVFSSAIWNQYYYVLQWNYSGGTTPAYNQIWNGPPTGYRDWVIRNFDGSYRDTTDQYGWVVSKLYRNYLRSSNWTMLGSYAWSYQPDLNNIGGLNSPLPVDGEQLVARNYKWGLNLNPDYLNRYDQSYTELGFNNIFGKLEKVSDIAWGKGLEATQRYATSSITYKVIE